ncbi:hypothetical protein [Nocardia nova]|jgi:hypothetical protein|uniref:hypothetical protein n=1 Tax=Nocardia nova TaxID=37330 RepID=UPI000A87F89A|nr:hypothetical protein [Nocardia nova]
MGELIELVASKQALVVLGTAVLIFGFCPGLILRQIVRMYPKGHPRRAEIIAELYAIAYVMRPIWVAAQLETALHEGLSLRRSGRKTRRDARRLSRNQETASTITHADLLVADKLFGLGSPDAIRVVADHRGIHYWAPERHFPLTMDPRTLRFLALSDDSFKMLLTDQGLSACVEDWQRDKDNQRWYPLYITIQNFAGLSRTLAAGLRYWIKTRL